MGLDLTARMVTTLRNMGAAKRPRAQPAPRFPTAEELLYARALVEFTKKILATYQPLIDAMPRLLTSSLAGLEIRSDAGEGDFAKKLLAEAREQQVSAIRAEDIANLATLTGQRTSIAQRAELAKQIKAGLGVDIAIDESKTRRMIELFANENAQAIGSIPAKLHADFAALTMRAFTKRMTPETFAAEILKFADVSENKARQLATNQIGNLTANLAEVRNRDLGIVSYIWWTMQDSIVREAHKKRHGKVFYYDDPPADGQGHAGHPFGCRCQQKPNLENVLEAIAKLRAHAGQTRIP